jgi:predicted kinase
MNDTIFIFSIKHVLLMVLAILVRYRDTGVSRRSRHCSWPLDRRRAIADAFIGGRYDSTDSVARRQLKRDTPVIENYLTFHAHSSM